MKAHRYSAAAALLFFSSIAAHAAPPDTAACNSSFQTCATICTVSGIFGVLISRSRGDTSTSQQCLDKCSSTQQQCLAGVTADPGAPGSASSGGTLRWPGEGGIEQWAGFSRPAGCAADLYYLEKVYSDVNAKLGMAIAFSETRNFYSSPAVTDFIKNPQALEIMQRDLDRFAKIATDAREVASSVVKLSSAGETPSAIIDQIRALRFDNLQCSNSASGMRAQHFCGAAIKLVELTHRVEGMIQMACRMGVATPTYRAGGT